MICNKKKVMLINFPLLDVGGITTWAHQITKGFSKLGIVADHYYATPTGRYKTAEDTFTFIGKQFRRGEKVPSKTLGYYGEENIKIYKALLEQYDYVIFVHPSPHPTKANKLDEKILHWQNLYKECSIPKVVVFHDKKWHKTNKWFLDVIKHIDVALAAQHNFIDSVHQYCNHERNMIKRDWLFFPINMDGVDVTFPEKDNKLCMMPQWIKWKNHDKILKVGKDIKLPIHFYNGGMEYHKLRHKYEWIDSIHIDWVEDEYVNREAKHEYFGFVTYLFALDVYRKSLGSIDLTTRTYQNYTMHEPSLYGCVPLLTEECRAGPYNHIHEGEYWSIDMNDIAGCINKFIDIPNQDKLAIAAKARERTIIDFECSKIARKIQDIVENLKI